jgi:acetyl esterase
MLKINPDWFNPEKELADTKALNIAILKKCENWSNWAHPIAEIRRLRDAGLGPFPKAPLSPRAYIHDLDGLSLRIIEPKSPPRGVYLHIHGGGWVLGTADMQDPRNEKIADEAGLIVVSVEYRLAPEYPYPAANDDCEKAAHYVIKTYSHLKLYIGGESAGAHLSLCTLLRFRDKGIHAFHGANLHAGCYDLSGTPSCRNWTGGKLVMDNHDVEQFTRHYLVHGGDVKDPAISPLYARLNGLPPALFTVGTYDPLLDDTLFMAQRYLAAGNATDLECYNGGCHVFIGFPSTNAKLAHDRVIAFLIA